MRDRSSEPDAARRLHDDALRLLCSSLLGGSSRTNHRLRSQPDRKEQEKPHESFRRDHGGLLLAIAMETAGRSKSCTQLFLGKILNAFRNVNK